MGSSVMYVHLYLISYVHVRVPSQEVVVCFAALSEFYGNKYPFVELWGRRR